MSETIRLKTSLQYYIPHQIFDTNSWYDRQYLTVSPAVNFDPICICVSVQLSLCAVYC